MDYLRMSRASPPMGFLPREAAATRGITGQLEPVRRAA